MKQLSNRIWIEEEGQSTRIEISAKLESWKQTLLLSWFVAWTFCGLVVISQLFLDQTQDVFIALVVYVSFWLYFEYKIAHSVLWRLFGKEVLLIEPGMLRIKRDIKGYGKVIQYFQENIRKLRLVEKNPKSFAQSYQRSFWVIGGEQIVFENLGTTQGFGMQLDEKEAKSLLQFIRKKIKS